MAIINYVDLPLQKYWSAEEERCGFILKDGTVLQLENIASDKANNFEIADEDVDQYAEDIAATWHTHCRSTANLSQADYELFLQVPDWIHVIVSQNEQTYYFTDTSGFLMRGDTISVNH